MALTQLFNKFSVPLEVKTYILELTISKDNHNKLLQELVLQYNNGLWWLSKIRFEDNLFCEDDESYITDLTLLHHQSKKVEFTTYDDNPDICHQALLHEDILCELNWGKG